MPRSFNGVNDVLTLSIGNDSGLTSFGTVAMILKLNDTTDGSPFYTRSSGGAGQLALEVHGGNYILNNSTGAVGLGSASTADNWHLFAYTKTSGTTTPVFHKYVYGTDAWTHANASGGSIANGASVGANGSILIGPFDTDYINAEFAVIGYWAGTVLTNAQIEQLPFTLAAWDSLAPSGLFLFDQASTSQSVEDRTGGGSNQTALTGTTVSTESVPVFSYGHPVLPSLAIPTVAPGLGAHRFMPFFA